MNLHADKFTDNYEKNKDVVNSLILTPSKKLRNAIAGYVTRLVKKSREPQKIYTAQREDIGKYY